MYLIGEKKSMVQKEVKKKTSIYATVAVLSAIVLVSTIYVFGSAPMLFPPSDVPTVTGMKTFSSIDELKNYLNTNAQDQVWTTSSTKGVLPPAPARITQGNGLAGESAGTYTMDSSYSNTNIQVSGVDEADTVKTDGNYIYTIASSQTNGIYNLLYYAPVTTNTIYIVKADPQNPQLASKITLDNDTQPAGLFLSPDGNKLVVLASKYQAYDYPTISRDGAATSMIAPYYYNNVYTYINVYDVSNKAAPVLTRNFTASGSYFNSRMIGNYVYIVVSQSAAVYNNIVTLPVVYEGQKEAVSSPTSIYYTDTNQSSYYTFTSFYGLDVTNDGQQPTNMTVMMDGTSNMYVSPSNIYVTYPTWTETGSYTSIYRVSINGLQLSFDAKGSVPGDVINQYAMDEYSGNFRVATYWYNYAAAVPIGPEGVKSSGDQSSQINNVYVLNQNLTIIGKLEGLAPGENLHSVRFMGDKTYLVTFKRTDPLFVIDLSQPTNPRLLGELKVPGYSDYLHPYDATHLIGVGKEAEDIATESFAYYQGVKIALFDVSDVNNPQQIANYIIGDRGTDSPVLSDPKAFLFDKTKNLLVIPVSLALVANKTSASDYGQTVWQGAYVFTITESGITLKGTVTHLDSSLLNSQGQLVNPNNYWNTQSQWISRSLYIGNTLYTISSGQIKLNSLTDVSQIGSVSLQ